MNTHNVTVKTAAQEPSERYGLTAGQFFDLCDHVYACGRFTGFGGIDWHEVNCFECIDEPTDLPEGLTLYLHNGWPIAVHQFDTGYVVMPAALAEIRTSYAMQKEEKPQT